MARQVAVAVDPGTLGSCVAGGAMQVVRFLVIAYVALLIFALAGYFLTTVLPWFVKVIVPIIS